MKIVTEKNIACEICNLKLPTYSSLRTHILTKHCGKSFICSICDTKLGSKTSLKNHVKSIHMGNPNTKVCPECYKEVSVSNFTRHVKETHWQEKKMCPHCKKLFCMSTLRKHIRSIHDKEQHPCQHCGKTFNEKGNLSSHIKKVHMKLNTICGICDEEILWSMKSIHKRTVHNNETQMKSETSKSNNKGKNQYFPQKSKVQFHFS